MISSLPALYLAYGVLYGFGVGLGYNAIMGTIVKWFPDKTGLASGILLMGFGISSLIVGKVGARLIGEIGWRDTFMYFGIAFGIIVLVLSFSRYRLLPTWRVCRRRPARNQNLLLNWIPRAC